MSQFPSTISLSCDSFPCVRKYLTLFFLIIGSILLSVFWGFSYKTSILIRGQLLLQGRAFFEEILIAREWNTIQSNHG